MSQLLHAVLLLHSTLRGEQASLQLKGQVFPGRHIHIGGLSPVPEPIHQLRLCRQDLGHSPERARADIMLEG